MNARQDVTRLLQALSRGEREAIHALLPVVYGELRRRAGGLMRAERQDHTLQPTALVHEVFMHLVGLERVDWKSRAHFFAVASQLMRRILVDHARSRRAAKRSGGQTRIPLGPDLSFSIARDLDVLAVDETLRRLAVLNPRHAEIVSMRFFGGLSVGEVAVVLDTPKRTLEAEWTLIKAWIRRELAAE